MNWINENLQILATLGSALAVYGFIRWGSRKDVEGLEKRVEKGFDRLDSDLKEIKVEISNLKDRVSRIEPT